jgi:hypothetical protein
MYLADDILFKAHVGFPYHLPLKQAVGTYPEDHGKVCARKNTHEALPPSLRIGRLRVYSTKQSAFRGCARQTDLLNPEATKLPGGQHLRVDQTLSQPTSHPRGCVFSHVATRRKSSALRPMKAEEVTSVDNAVCSPQKA